MMLALGGLALWAALHDVFLLKSCKHKQVIEEAINHISKGNENLTLSPDDQKRISEKIEDAYEGLSHMPKALRVRAEEVLMGVPEALGYEDQRTNETPNNRSLKAKDDPELSR